MSKHNPILNRYSRAERRSILGREKIARTTQRWGDWIGISFPKGTVGKNGFPYELNRAYKNKAFSVLVRDLPNGVIHFAISTLSDTRPTWPEMQRIKTELAGASATGVEVYPPEDEVVDGANMYHLWILPTPLPFTLAEGKRS